MNIFFLACYNEGMRNRFTGRPATTRGRTLDRGTNTEEEGLIQALDQLAVFEDFQKDMLPKLQALVKKGAKTDEILEMGRALAVARLVTIAATEPDSGKALAAVRELLDRREGKVTDKREVTHRMANLKDEELDALVLTALNEATNEDGSESP